MQQKYLQAKVVEIFNSVWGNQEISTVKVYVNRNLNVILQFSHEAHICRINKGQRLCLNY